MSPALTTEPLVEPFEHIGGADREAGVIPRPTNPMDSLMEAVNGSLRSMGLPGFETQALVWLRGRIDVPRLRSGIARLGRRYPVITARLVAAAGRSSHWRRRIGAEASLHEITLSAHSQEAVMEEAARLLSAPHDLAEADPIQFFLLHLPDGNDLFLMQYNHVLMDNNAGVPVIREIDRLAGIEGHDEEDAGERRDAMGEYLQRFPLRRRLRAAWRAADLRLRVLRFHRTTLGGAGTTAEPGPFHLFSRTLEADESAALHARVIEVCRWPGISMAILGSAFRALDRLAPAAGGRWGYAAGIGVDLGLRGRAGPLFQNLVSLFPIAARREELAERDSLMRGLNRQLRERLEREADLGVIELARIFRRFPAMFRRSTARILRDSYSLWYAYFGSTDAIGERFCGSQVSDVRYVGPCWPSAGLTLLVNQSHGRTHFQVTSLPSIVPDAVVSEFLDAVLADLRAFAAATRVADA